MLPDVDSRNSAALTGVGVGGAIGGITGALVGMGIPEYEAKRYEGRVKEGGILLSVHSDNSDWTRKAKDILERTGAADISSTGEAHVILRRATDPCRAQAETLYSDQSRSPAEKAALFSFIGSRQETLPRDLGVFYSYWGIIPNRI